MASTGETVRSRPRRRGGRHRRDHRQRHAARQELAAARPGLDRSGRTPDIPRPYAPRSPASGTSSGSAARSSASELDPEFFAKALATGGLLAARHRRHVRELDRDVHDPPQRAARLRPGDVPEAPAATRRSSTCTATGRSSPARRGSSRPRCRTARTGTSSWTTGGWSRSTTSAGSPSTSTPPRWTDGRLTIVVADEDPGWGNWIDTCGHTQRHGAAALARRRPSTRSRGAASLILEDHDHRETARARRRRAARRGPRRPGSPTTATTGSSSRSPC